MWILGRKGASGFSARSTAEEVTSGIDGASLTAIVTGATSGIGTETARTLALRGVNVVMAVRNMEAGRALRDEILGQIPSAKVRAMELDLSSMASVRKFASEYESSGLPLNILINNAGIMGNTFTLSEDNIELHFATNHIGHFLLTNLLLENMKRTSKQSKREGRIVNVSSDAYQLAKGIRFDRINDRSGYTPMAAYGRSKLANILHSNELARIFQTGGMEITSNSVHPGFVATNILRTPGIFYDTMKFLGHVLKYLVKNPQQGAATQCYVALHPKMKGVSGQYFKDSNKSTTNSIVKDVDLAKQLWDFSLNITHPK